MTRKTFYALCLFLALFCPTSILAQGLSKPTITNIPGGFFVEWNSPVEVTQVQLDKKLTGPCEVMFDVPSAASLAEILDKKSTPPSNTAMIATLADYWLFRGKPERAIPLYENCLKQANIEESRAWIFQNNLAMIYSRAFGQHEKALAIVDSALNTDSDNVVLINTKGLVLLNSGNPTDAVPALQRAVELSCQLPLYCMHLAYAYHQLQRAGQARRWFDLVRAQLNESTPGLNSKENKAMLDALQQALPPAN
jgi:tetratricopeptide (TPR) repeat protein